MTQALWHQARNVLCIRLDGMGDVLMTTPALRALKACHPDRRLTLLTSLAGAEVAALIPEIDQVIPYEAPWMKASATREGCSAEFELIELLRSKQFDAAVIFTVFSQNPLPAALLCYLAQIPLRLAHCHENPYQLLSDWVLDPDPHNGIRHEVRRQLDLVASIGSHAATESLSLQIPNNAQNNAKSLLHGLGLDLTHPWIAIHPGATASSRRYAPEKFAEVARCLSATSGYPIVFTGTASEQALVETIRQKMVQPAYSLVGKLTLAELAAVLKMAALLIANNSGPAHVAAAVGTPVVSLYALTNPQHTPWGIPSDVLNQDVPCKFCYKSICPEGHHHCLALVSPAKVVRSACTLLHEIKQSEHLAASFLSALVFPPLQLPLGR